jgi:hypothetical protein
VILNELAEAAMLLTCVREVPGSSLGWDTGFRDRGVWGLPHSPQANVRVVP